jgi:hypothetical protein
VTIMMPKKAPDQASAEAAPGRVVSDPATI